MFEGYAGTSASGFAVEVAAEETVALLDYVEDLYRDWNNGAREFDRTRYNAGRAADVGYRGMCSLDCGLAGQARPLVQPRTPRYAAARGYEVATDELQEDGAGRLTRRRTTHPPDRLSLLCPVECGHPGDNSAATNTSAPS
jgi:hypothetical protein